MSLENEITEALAARIHAASGQGVLVLTSGGSGALAALLRTPGASRTVLEAHIPYGEKALIEFLGGRPDRACAPDTARAMAMAAFHRARHLAPGAEVFGLSCTASLATDRPKKGGHRVHVALQTSAVSDLFSVELTPGARSRAEEEALCDRLVLNVTAEAKMVTPAPAPEWTAGETLAERRCQAPSHWRDLALGRLRATEARSGAPPPAAAAPRLIFPGAFDPVHAGHLGMAAIAREMTGLDPEFELCIRNVDKPPLNYAAIRDRIGHLPATATVWLTATPTFVEKARLFAGATFMLGIDTLERIADPRYYGDEPAVRDAAVSAMADAGCRFLVFGRTRNGTFTGLDDHDWPAALRALCSAVPEARFRHDMSSTAIRAARDDRHD